MTKHLILLLALIPNLLFSQQVNNAWVNVPKSKSSQINETLLSATIQKQFLSPPAQARPLVYWFWMGSNFSKSGITKDLEAMKTMGIGGGLIMNITSAVEETHAPTLNNPWPEQTYRSKAYWEALAHAGAEAKRLGLELGIHNSVGYSTNGGPWINEAQSMKKLVWRKVEINTDSSKELFIPKPDAVVNTHAWGRRGLPPIPSIWYNNIAYLGISIKDTALYEKSYDFTSHFDTTGKCIKALPAGHWVIYRIGFAPSMSTPHPLPEELFGKCQEVDKMNKQHTQHHWNKVLNPLQQYLRPYLGNSFKYMHIDSYEAQGQNWTANFRDSFMRLKGYDPLPWLLTFTPTVLNTNKGATTIRNKNSAAQTLRFEWDYKDVINRLFYQNGWEVAQKMIHAKGMQFSWEPYAGSFEAADGAAISDFVMGEFWTFMRNGIGATVTSSARAAGKTMIGAEAFTSRPEHSKWTDDPEFLKPSGDAAFASGANRFVLHQWALQPFNDQYQPGMDMGWWGTHFSRHQTWFKPGKAFIDYLSRCQALLQLGEQVADVLYVGKIEGYGDLITTHRFITQPPKVVDGKVVLASGRSYKYVVVTGNGEMLPEVAEQIKRLVEAGAMVVSAKPTTSPSLYRFPICDTVLKQLAQEVWGNKPFQPFGKGYIFNTIKTLKENLPPNVSLSPDYQLEKPIQTTTAANNNANAFTPKIVHRQLGNAHLFFVVNPTDKPQQFTLSFAVQGMQPELWQAENGSMVNAPIWEEKNNRTHVWLSLRKLQTLFVVFRKKPTANDHATSLENTQGTWQIGIDKAGLPLLFTDTAATGILNYASGKKQSLQTTLPTNKPITQAWNVAFNPKLDTSFTLKMESLIDFSKHPLPQVKYFSGTATYNNRFTVSSTDLKNGERWILNLGTLNDLVEVSINQQKIATLWYAPYQIDITSYITLGVNNISLAVTNNWANRLIGEEQIPADFEWGNDRGDKGHAMKAYPDWFIKQQPRPSKRKAFSIWYYNRKDTPLHPAGLVGPVVIQKMEVIRL